MKFKFLLIATFTLVSAKSLSESKTEFDDGSNSQIRDKRESEVSVLDELVKTGVASKRNAEPDNEKQSGKTLQEVESKAPAIPKIALSENPPGLRVKKQSPVLDCGKTACGSLVSGYGPNLGEVRNYMQGNPPPKKDMVLDEVDTPKMNPPMDYSRMNPPMMDYNRMMPPNDHSRMNPPPEFSRMNGPPPTEYNRMNGPTEFNRMNPPAEFSRMSSPENQRTQTKTFEILGYNPGTYGTYSSGGPAGNTYSSGGGSSGGYGVPSGSANSFFKPPVVPQQEIQHPIPVHSVHPWFNIPHPIITLNPHRFYDYPSRIQDPAYFVPNDYRGPQPGYYNNEQFICQPLRNKKIYQDFAQDKIDTQVDDRVDQKQLNASQPAERTTDGSVDNTQVESVQEHLRKINEIKDQITELNRAAQRIVDQQEKLAELQQRHMSNGYKTGSGSQSNIYNGQFGMRQPNHYQRADDYDERAIPPYYGSYYPGYYPGGYARSSPASYPNSQEDTEFFMNLMHNLKRLGLLSNSFQQSIIAPVDDKKNGEQKNKESEDLVADLMNGDKQNKNTQTTNTKNDNKNRKQKEN